MTPFDSSVRDICTYISVKAWLLLDPNGGEWLAKYKRAAMRSDGPGIALLPPTCAPTWNSPRLVQKPPIQGYQDSLGKFDKLKQDYSYSDGGSCLACTIRWLYYLHWNSLDTQMPPRHPFAPKCTSYCHVRRLQITTVHIESCIGNELFSSLPRWTHLAISAYQSIPTYLNQLGLQSSLNRNLSPSVKRPVTHPLHLGDLGQLK